MSPVADATTARARHRAIVALRREHVALLAALVLTLLRLTVPDWAWASQSEGSQSASTAAYLYWDNPQSNSIGRDTIDGDPTNVDQNFVSGIHQDNRLGVAVDGRYIYWSNGLWIGRSNLDGTGVDPEFIHLRAAVDYLTVFNEHLYWATESSIGDADLSGTPVADTLLTPGCCITGLAVDSLYVYWTNLSQKSVARARLDGTGPEPSFIALRGVPDGLAVDGQFIYWSEGAAGTSAGTIGRANLDGTGVDSNFIYGAFEPRGVALDLGHVYWANTFNCDYQTQPPSACGGGTIGRANLDGSSVDQSFVTAAHFPGPGCLSSPETRCGPFSVAVSALTQPVCLQADPPPAPAGGAVFARPLDPSSSNANVVVLPAGSTWSTSSPCTGIPQGANTVMTQPTSISVAPGAAALLHDDAAGLTSAWGAQNVSAGDAAPVFFPGRSDWQTTEVDLVAPQQLLDSSGGCPGCILPDKLQLTPGQAHPTVAYQDDVHGAALNGATLSGSFDGWNLSGAQLAGASLNGVDVSGANFSSADLRGAQLTSLFGSVPPDFANIQVGQVTGPCTTFKNVDLRSSGVSLAQATSGCDNSPLFPGSTVPLGLIAAVHGNTSLAANVDLTNAIFVSDASDRSSLAGQHLEHIDLSGTTFLGWPVDLTQTHLDGANLTGAQLNLAVLTGATLTGVTAPDASFVGASFAASTNGSIPPATFGAQSDQPAGRELQPCRREWRQLRECRPDARCLQPRDAVRRGAGRGHRLHQRARPQRHLQRRPHLRQVGRLRRRGSDPGQLQQCPARRRRQRPIRLHRGHRSPTQPSTAHSVSPATSPSAHLDHASFNGAYLPGVTLANATMDGTILAGAWLYCGDTQQQRLPHRQRLVRRRRSVLPAERPGQDRFAMQEIVGTPASRATPDPHPNPKPALIADASPSPSSTPTCTGTTGPGRWTSASARARGR